MAKTFSAQSCDRAVPAQASTEARALVPLTLPAKATVPPQRPDARFVVQLIATAERLPQARGLRRAAADDGATSYASIPRKIRVPANGAALSLIT